jgi:hypothetical protein
MALRSTLPHELGLPHTTLPDSQRPAVMPHTWPCMALRSTLPRRRSVGGGSYGLLCACLVWPAVCVPTCIDVPMELPTWCVCRSPGGRRGGMGAGLCVHAYVHAYVCAYACTMCVPMHGVMAWGIGTA